MISTVMQRLSEFEREQEERLEEQSGLIANIEGCFKQARIILEDSHRRFDEFKRMVGLPRSYLDWKAASIGVDSWKGKYMYALMDRQQDYVMIKQTAHDVAITTEETIRRLTVILNDFTEGILRNRQREQSELVMEE